MHSLQKAAFSSHSLLKRGWETKNNRNADVVAAFINGIVEEEFYIECLEGMKKDDGNKCLKLTRAIYGLVSAARQYDKKHFESPRYIGFTGVYADPCLLIEEIQS